MNSTSVKPSPTSSIWSPGFQGLLWTNWLTAINDNVFRWFVIGVGKDFWEPEHHGALLAVGSACFALPYILFASIAGWLADRFSKRNVIIGCKFAEIAIMTLGVAALSMQSLVFLLITVALMGAQSALFAPAKVGTIPELLDEKTISAGNGIFNLATLSATIIGMGIGSWLSDYTGTRGQEHIMTTAAVLIGIAVFGTMLSFLIKSFPAGDKSTKFPITIIGETIREVILLVKSGPLFRVALGIVFFWSIAALAQINIDAFSEESGGFLESHKTPLLISLVLGVGVGSVLSGIVSGGRIELGLVPIGAIGIALFACLLWLAPGDFKFGADGIMDWRKIFSCLLLAGLGISAGCYDVPLASYLQHRSPIESRGKILAATNCLAFGGMLLMFALFFVARLGFSDGSFENLPASLSGKQLEQTELAKISEVEKSFRSSFHASTAGTRPELGSYLAVIDSPALRSATAARLLWTDIEERQSVDEAKTIDQYRSELPEEPLAVRNVVLQSSKLPMLSSRTIFLLIGLLTFPVVAFAAWRLPRKMARMVWWLGLNTVYRTKVRGLENIPENGSAILVFNHCSWLDGVTILTLLPETPRTIAWSGNFKNPLMKWWADFCGVILMGAGPKSIRKGLESAREALANGELVALFPEGGITQTGQIRSLKPGVIKIAKSSGAPVVPCIIDEMWGSIFSYKNGKSLNRLPTSFRRPLSLHIGKPIENPESVFEIRQAMQRLSTESVNHRVGKFVSPPQMLIKNCKKRKFSRKICDSTGQAEKGGTLLTKALVLRRLVKNHVLAADETNVGVLIPPSNGGTIVNLALALDRRVAINLNYTLSEELVNACIELADIKHVLTSRKVMDKLGYNLNAEVIYLEDFKEKVTGVDKGIAALQSYAVPAFLLSRWLGLNRIQPNDLMTVIFTSGSTGVPKGVMLSQRNIISNMKAIDQAAGFSYDDTIVGVLPFFHSFGFTATLWAGTACDMKAAYHFSPLDAKQLSKLVKRNKGTILVATPTFLRSYLKRCKQEDLESLDIVVSGAERLPPEVSLAFEEKFGVLPVEGYGATELSPITTVNIPPSRQHGKFQVDAKPGTVGRSVAHVSCKVTDLDTGEELGCGESGMLWIAGPNVMLGYLKRDDLTQEAIVDGWYKTGDVAEIDMDGFVKITGRMSRFSKIGGEMVPHIKIEEILTKVCDDTPDDDADDMPNVAVTSIPDKRKGERLIVLHTELCTTTDNLIKSLSDAGLPNIYIPSPDSFRQVDALPLLGTGKLDLKGLKQMALDLYEAE